MIISLKEVHKKTEEIVVKKRLNLETSFLLTRSQNDPDFRWRTKEGDFLHPKEMQTEHLFFTLLMIWNNSCPKEWKIWNTPPHCLGGGIYTLQYIKTAILCIFIELLHRTDLTEQFIFVLNKIAKYLTQKEELEE